MYHQDDSFKCPHNYIFSDDFFTNKSGIWSKLNKFVIILLIYFFLWFHFLIFSDLNNIKKISILRYFVRFYNGICRIYIEPYGDRLKQYWKKCPYIVLWNIKKLFTKMSLVFEKMRRPVKIIPAEISGISTRNHKKIELLSLRTK